MHSLPLLLLFASISGSSGAGLAAMSVDFGSQFIKVGLVKPGVPMEMALNRESHRKTAAVVGIRNGERTFSTEGLHTAVKHPKEAYSHLLDLLGKKYDNPMVELFRSRFPIYDIQRGEDDLPVFVAGEERYKVVELVAMLLAEARAMTEKYADQTVKDAVIAVPPYFNQAERRAMADAAKIAGLNLLQLMNDNAAMGVNYGMFRRKIFNESATHTLVFDMGATKTTATVFEYQVVKDKVTGEKNPQVSIIGFGYDRTLGGLEMTLRLRDHLLKAAEETVKSKQPIREELENPRAMAKLLKEAERLKLVLSANTEFVAQIENLLEDKDFKVRVTRDDFELPNQDLWGRIRPVLDQALQMAEMSLEQIDTILLFGGATRVPMVQLRLKENLGGREPARFLNTDEAVALGAVYQAAHLSVGFKVLKFHVKDATLFPIQVDFEKEMEANEESTGRIIHRTLFGLKNPYPQKKVMTFSKHRRDFTFNVNYGDPKWMTPTQLQAFGSMNLTKVDLSGVAKAAEDFVKEKAEEEAALAKAKDESEQKAVAVTEWKGIKAHFRVDDSGLLNLDGAEVILERTGAEPEEESTLSKIGKKLGSLFSSSDEKEKKDDKEKKEEKDEKKEDEKPSEDKEKKDSKEKEKSGEKTDKKEETVEKTEKAGNETKKEPPKPRIVKVALGILQECLDVGNSTEDQIKDSRKRLEKFEEAEAEKASRERSQNALESFIYETNDRLDQKEYSVLVTAEEMEGIREKLRVANTWAEDDADFNTKASEYDDKLKPLKEATRDLFYRYEEAKERPRATEALVQMLNYSSVFLAGMKNLTEDIQMFTQVEIDGLEKLITETTEWRKKTEEEQSKLKPHETPVMTMYAVGEKVKALDREVKYLLNKAKTAKPLNPKKEENATAEEAPTTGEEAKEEGKEEAKEEGKEEPKEEEKEAKEEAKEDNDTTAPTEEEDTTTHTTEL